jgi:outer membrane lipoprotein-sorting protein
MFAVLLALAAVAADTPTADALLMRVDANMVSATRTNRTSMQQTTSTRTRPAVEMLVMARGNDTAAIEYLAPARDKGTKMLREGDAMRLYTPEAEKVTTLSGHLLRDGMSGTDVSYEDMMATTVLRTAYTGSVKGQEACGTGRTCWRLELTAKNQSIAYTKRVSWIDTEWSIPLKQELYDLSGNLVKTWEMTDVRPIGTRFFPHKMVVTNAVQKGNVTTLVLSDVQFDVALADEVFTTRWLERH